MRVLGGLGILALVLVVVATAPAAKSTECGSEYLRIDGAPEWSPDGGQIAFLRRRIFDCQSGGAAVLSVEVGHADGTDRRTLLSGPNNLVFAAWSPDGKRIAVVSVPAGPGGVLRVVDVRDGREQLHVQLPFCCTDRPSWSPDGKHIALGATVVDVASGNMRSPSISTTGSTAWSPDGRRIAYLGPVGLEVASADGATRQWIGPGGGSTGTVHWSADGSRIAYQITRELRFVHPDGSDFLEMPDEALLLGWAPDSKRVLTYVPEDHRLLTIARDDGSSAVVGSAESAPLSFSWSRGASAFIDVDLCPRPGVFVRNADAEYRRLTNDCVIRGTKRADRLVGTTLPDAIVGDTGNDTIFGLGGGDVLYRNAGRDQVSGGAGDDTAFGGAGNDTVAAETVTGGSGNDTLTLGNNPQWPAKAVHARDGQRDVIRCPWGSGRGRSSRPTGSIASRLPVTAPDRTTISPWRGSTSRTCSSGSIRPGGGCRSRSGPPEKTPSPTS